MFKTHPRRDFSRLFGVDVLWRHRWITSGMGLSHPPGWDNISPDVKIGGYSCLKSEKKYPPDFVWLITADDRRRARLPLVHIAKMILRQTFASKDFPKHYRGICNLSQMSNTHSMYHTHVYFSFFLITSLHLQSPLPFPIFPYHYDFSCNIFWLSVTTILIKSAKIYASYEEPPRILTLSIIEISMHSHIKRIKTNILQAELTYRIDESTLCLEITFLSLFFWKRSWITGHCNLLRRFVC